MVHCFIKKKSRVDRWNFKDRSFKDRINNKKNIIPFTAFSLNQWYDDNGITHGQQLSRLQASKLLQALEIAEFMQPNSCQRSGPTYSPSVQGWKSGM